MCFSVKGRYGHSEPELRALGRSGILDVRDPRASAIRVLFADDHKVMRQGLIQLVANQPDIHVVGEAANGRLAFELTRQLKPDLIVMDVSMPEMDGIMATRLIKTEMPNVRVVGLSMFEDEQVTQAMRLAGADAFISKTSSSAELLRTIYSVTQNHPPQT